MENKGKNSILKKCTVEAAHAGMTLETYLKEVLKVAARKRQKLFFSKTVYLNGRSAHSKHTVKAGDTVGIREFIDTNYGVTPEKATVEVLYEDAEIIVLNKPAGILVHPTGQTKGGTLANHLAYYFKQKREMVTIRPLHRLDRDTTGCVLFAKSAKTQNLLEQAMAAGEIHRHYEALVASNGKRLEQLCPEGRINLPIGRDPFKPNQRRVTDKGQAAVTCFKVIETLKDKLLLELELETGRTHQIRVHFSYLGFPVVGDKMYGTASRLLKRQALHAKYLEFKHPITGASVVVNAPRPHDLENAIKLSK